LSVTISIFAGLSFIDRRPIWLMTILKMTDRARQEKSQKQNPNATGG